MSKILAWHPYLNSEETEKGLQEIILKGLSGCGNSSSGVFFFFSEAQQKPKTMQSERLRSGNVWISDSMTGHLALVRSEGSWVRAWSVVCAKCMTRLSFSPKAQNRDDNDDHSTEWLQEHVDWFKQHMEPSSNLPCEGRKDKVIMYRLADVWASGLPIFTRREACAPPAASGGHAHLFKNWGEHVMWSLYIVW